MRNEALCAPLSNDEIAVVERFKSGNRELRAGADALGLTTVHVNRTLRALREAELVSVRGRTLSLRDPDALAALAGFDPESVLSHGIA